MQEHARCDFTIADFAVLPTWALNVSIAPMIPVPRLVFPEADVAPFISAFLARYVVAAGVLDGRDPAVRTRLNVVLSCKCDELIVADVGAPHIAVGDCTAAHADLLPARTRCHFGKSAGLFNVVEATNPRAPAQGWVQVNVDVQLKTDVLLENLLAPKLLDVFLGKLLLTPMHHARKLDHLTVRNTGRKILR